MVITYPTSVPEVVQEVVQTLTGQTIVTLLGGAAWRQEVGVETLP
tara:strand:- start:6483 stop:6617 length:135 start_codon:yes stop_codon:yes gene_type:complete